MPIAVVIFAAKGAASTHRLWSVICGIWVLLGCGILKLALRGKRIDDHPHCRKCRYDLFQLPAQTTRCPECGAELTLRRSRTIGTFRRRPLGILFALVLLLPAVMLVSLSAVREWKAFDVNRIKPVSWLIEDTRGSVKARDAALNELLDRLVDKKLSQAQVDQVVAEALRVQKTASIATWSNAWGDIVQGAREVGMVPEAQWKQYLLQAPQIRLRTRQLIQHGKMLPVSLTLDTYLMGSSPIRSLRILLNCESQLDELPLTKKSDLAVKFERSGHGWGWMELQPFPPKIRVAEHLLKVNVKLKVLESPSDREVAGKEIDLPAKVTMVDHPTATAKVTPELRQRLKKAITLSSAERFSAGDGKEAIQLNLSYNNVPMAICGHLTIRSGDQIFHCGNHVMLSRTQGQISTANVLVPSDFPDSFEAVLEPAPETAEATLDVTEYWGEEITFKNVKCVRGKRDFER